MLSGSYSSISRVKYFFWGAVLLTISSLHRQAQELGLHRQKEIYQSDETNIGETLSIFWYEQNKKRLWINLFVWDG